MPDPRSHFPRQQTHIKTSAQFGNFFIIYIANKQGEYAGVSMYGGADSRYVVCTENGAELAYREALLAGSSSG